MSDDPFFRCAEIPKGRLVWSLQPAKPRLEVPPPRQFLMQAGQADQNGYQPVLREDQTALFVITAHSDLHWLLCEREAVPVIVLGRSHGLASRPSRWR
jgi:hypothetical protein